MLLSSKKKYVVGLFSPLTGVKLAKEEKRFPFLEAKM